jgi:hypothetical protein
MSTVGKSSLVAVRHLRTASGREVIVKLFRPVRKSTDDWHCTFRIAGLSEPIEARGRGMDALQALTVAIDGIRVHLEQSPEPLSWLDGEPGDIGLTRSLPYGFGVNVDRHLSKMVSTELNRIIEAKKRSARKRR